MKQPKLTVTVVVLAAVLLFAVVAHKHANTQVMRPAPNTAQTQAAYCIDLSKYCAINQQR